MSDVMAASIKEKLWHKMRGDLAAYVPDVAANRLLMCCTCGRFLPQECFDLEHLIPRQALKRDPAIVRANPDTPINTRAGNLLLCKQPLRYKGNRVYDNGCNSWKGRFYDKPINDLLSGEAWQPQKTTQLHIIAGLCLGYLAMVAEFGYRIVLMQSGLMMREQFFNPYSFQRAMPVRSQLLLGGGTGVAPPDAPMWRRPFTFTYRGEICVVTARNFGMSVPVSQDPYLPIARHLRIAPSRFKLRPDFRAVFD